MGKLIKAVCIVFSVVVVLIIAAVIIIPLVVDVNDYKPEMEAAVKDKTGRTLTIDGDLNLSVFPWLGVSTGRIILSNAPGFAEKSFAVIGESEIKVKLLPLLSKEVEVSTVVLKGLELNLAKNKDGLSNWDDLVKPAAEEQEPTPQQTEPAKQEEPVTDSGSALAALAIGGLVIEHSQISWDDQQSDQHAVVKDFNLTFGAVTFNEPIAIEMSFIVDSKNPAVSEQLSLSTELSIDETLQKIQLTQLNIDSNTKGEMLSGGEALLKLQSDVSIDLQSQKVKLSQLKIDTTATGGALPESEMVAHLQSDISMNLPLQQFQLTQFKLDTTTKGKVVPGGLLKADISSEITLDLNQQTAVLKALKLNTNLINLTGDISVTQLKSDLQYAGPIQIAPFNPKALLAKLQMDVPETTDPQVLKQLAMRFKLQGTADSIALENLQLALDNTKISGYTRINQFKNPAIAFKLAIDDIDVDRYTAPKKASGATPVATPAAATAAATTLIPMDTIRALNVNGDLSIGKLKVAQLKMAGVNLNVQAKQGIVKTRQSIKQLYSGNYQGRITVNAKPSIPVISLNEKIANVQIEPLLKDLQPEQQAKAKGTANIAANLKTTGNTVEALKSTLGGNLSFSLQKGAIKGFNIQKMIDIGRLASKGKEMQQNYANEQTVFSVIKGTAAINKGLINNPDFLAESSTIEIKGGGTANLVNEALDYKVVAKIKKAGGSIKDRPVAINLSGTFTEPAYTLDLMSMISEREQQKIDKVIDKHLGEGAGKAVNDLLKSFF